MKYLKKHTEYIIEISRKDIGLIKSLQDTDLFTVAYEFELVCDDQDHYLVNHQTIKHLCTDIVDNIKDEFNLKSAAKYKSLCKKIQDEYAKYQSMSINKFKEILDSILDNSEEHEYIRESLLGELIGGKIEFGNKILEENLEYLKTKVEEHLPDFYQKWDSELTYELDASLYWADEETETYGRGIEFKPTTYVFSLARGIEMLDDFYADFDKQSYWKMTEKTGLHINIGINREIDWNPLKGMVMMSETSKVGQPYVFKEMTHRMNTNFTNSLKQKTIETIRKSKKLKEIISRLNLNEIEVLEDTLNPILVNVIEKFGVKYFGLNLIHLAEKKYVEFRHVGGNVPKELVIEKLIYFCYIVYLMTTDYKQNDYHKKLYKFMETLNGTV